MRNSYREVFPKRHTFLAVIHVDSAEQARRNTSIALDNGADGVFLINHHIKPFDLLKYYKQVRDSRPGAWIGLNLLGLSRTAALHTMDMSVSGLWVDDAGMDESLPQPQSAARDFYGNELSQCGYFFKGLYFGGVAFKGLGAVEDPARMAELAAPYMHVVTTSGPRTGFAPEVHKIKSMKSRLHGRAFAVASGMTPDNVTPFLPYVDCFLVATGISKSFTELDPALVRAFADKMEH